MNGTRTLVEMGDFYEKNIIEEKKSVFPPKDTFKTADAKKPEEAQADKKAFVKNTGPENADGFNKNIIDTKDKKLAKKDNFFEPEKFSQNLEKTETQTINTFMSKSIFDKLYEDVMSGAPEDLEAQDAEALGLPGDTEEGAGEDVTFSLPRDVAQKLCDVLQSALGEEEAGDEDSGEESSAGTDEASSDEANEENAEEKKDKKEEKKEEDNQEVAKEGTDMKELPASAGQSLQKKDNKVGDVTKSLTSSGSGDGKVTDKVGNDGEKGHALVGAGVKGGAPTSPKGKANVVNSKTSKVGAYLAGLK